MRRHFHQLFRQLRLAKSSTVRDPILKSDLGHSDNLLWQRLVEDFQDTHQLFYHLRHRSVEIEDRHWHEGSIICSTVCRRTRACGPATSGRGGDRPLPSSSSKTSKNSVSLPLAVFWPRGVLYCSCTTNSSFNGTERHAEWWSFSAKAIATLIRSCRSIERRRRSLLRLAELVVTRSTFIMMSTAKV